MKLINMFIIFFFCTYLCVAEEKTRIPKGFEVSSNQVSLRRANLNNEILAIAVDSVIRLLNEDQLNKILIPQISLSVDFKDNYHYFNFKISNSYDYMLTEPYFTSEHLFSSVFFFTYKNIDILLYFNDTTILNNPNGLLYQYFALAHKTDYYTYKYFTRNGREVLNYFHPITVNVDFCIKESKLYFLNYNYNEKGIMGG